MTSWQIVRIYAGCFILISLLLGLAASSLFVSRYWLLLAAFVALNLLQNECARWRLLETVPRPPGMRAGN